MAKRKKKKSDGAVPQSPGGSTSIDTGIENAENGYVIRISRSGGEGYESKKFIASTHPQALRIASHGMAGLIKPKADKKKGGKKKSNRKRI
jgi:hypothetical protein